MSIQKNHNQENTKITLEGLNRLREQSLSMSDQNRKEAEDKFQVELLIATFEESCRVLIGFTSGIESQLKTMNESQLKLLNLQKEYETKVRGEASRVINESYAVIENYQEKMFDKMHKDLEKSVNKMVKSIDGSVDTSFLCCACFIWTSSCPVGLSYHLSPQTVNGFIITSNNSVSFRSHHEQVSVLSVSIR